MHEDGKQQVPFLLVKDSCGNAHKGSIGGLHDIQVINAEEYGCQNGTRLLIAFAIKSRFKFYHTDEYAEKTYYFYYCPISH